MKLVKFEVVFKITSYKETYDYGFTREEPISLKELPFTKNKALRILEEELYDVLLMKGIIDPITKRVSDEHERTCEYKYFGLEHFEVEIEDEEFDEILKESVASFE